MPQYTIALIGAGNLGAHLATALHQAGHTLVAVCTRNIASAQALTQRLEADIPISTQISSLPPADFYILAIQDDAIATVVTGLREHTKGGGVVVHTAGSVPLEVLADGGQQYGVLYPLQTFSKSRAIDFSRVPCFVEGNNASTEQKLLDLASSISQQVVRLDSPKRARLHLAAVFACNFSNHLYDIASQLLAEDGMDFSWMLPLIDETVAKVHEASPREMQTGPARRGDGKVLERHLSKLEHQPHWQAVYKLLSQSIFQTYNSDETM